MAAVSIGEAQTDRGSLDPANDSPRGSTVPATRDLTDDEILGLGVRNRTRWPERREQDTESTEDPVIGAGGQDREPANNNESGGEFPREYRAVFDANPELKQVWDETRAYRQAFPTPEEAQAATKALGDFKAIDRLFYSNRTEDHAQLARLVAKLDPASFSSLAKAMATVATEPDGAKTQESPNAPSSIGERNTEPLPSPDHSDAADVRERFVHEANEEAVRSVLSAIESQVDRVLPSNASSTARNRFVGEIYRELDKSLQSNPEFAKRVRQAFQSGKLDAGHRSAVASLIAGRAKQGLPSALKRVLGEWTSTILASTGERLARQRSAESRVDIGGARGGAEAHRARSPRDIDYRRMSDADILNL
jgi:hypothetical protein